jgi:hypothetical protein
VKNQRGREVAASTEGRVDPLIADARERVPPIDTVEHIGQLRRTDRDNSIGWRGPQERPRVAVMSTVSASMRRGDIDAGLTVDRTADKFVRKGSRKLPLSLAGVAGAVIVHVARGAGRRWWRGARAC